MDRANVSLALAITDFQLTGGETANAQLERLYPCISGFDSTDLGAVDMIVKRMKEFPGLFKCIGEVLLRHDDLTNLTTGERPRANHPALFRIYDFAGEHGIPVSVHHNLAPVSPAEDPKEPLCLRELLDSFDEFPGTTFIWCHAGISRRIIVRDLTNLDGWATLIRKYPDNFVIGSDAVGRFSGFSEQIRIYDLLFDAINDSALVEKLKTRAEIWI